jgi:hypothetical protein
VTPAKATGYTIDQFLSPASPLELGAAKKADRIAYVVYERGMRNVYTAIGPDFKGVRITKFLDDDGVDVSSVRLSDDGTMAIFVRGSGQNRVGWVANPSHDPNGPDRSVWAAKTDARVWRPRRSRTPKSRRAAEESRRPPTPRRRQVRRLARDGQPIAPRFRGPSRRRWTRRRAVHQGVGSE